MIGCLGLLIVVFAADVVMQGHGEVVILGPRVFFIQLFFQNELDGFIVVGFKAQRPSAGIDQRLITYLLCKAQDPHTGLVSLLGVLLALKYFGDI